MTGTIRLATVILLAASSSSDSNTFVVAVTAAFVGAIVGSGLTVVAQWFLSPRIEQRVRAQERWEQFLIELATIVDGSLKQAQDAAREAWMGWHLLHEYNAEHPDRWSPVKFDEMNEERRASARVAIEAWREALVRPGWLAARIEGDYRLADDQVRMFGTKWRIYDFEGLRWDAWGATPEQDPEDWAKADERIRALRDALEVLSARIGAPVGIAQRLRARRRQQREQRTRDAAKANAVVNEAADDAHAD